MGCEGANPKRRRSRRRSEAALSPWSWEPAQASELWTRAPKDRREFPRRDPAAGRASHQEQKGPSIPRVHPAATLLPGGCAVPPPTRRQAAACTLPARQRAFGEGREAARHITTPSSAAASRHETSPSLPCRRPQESLRARLPVTRQRCCCPFTLCRSSASPLNPSSHLQIT